MFGHRKSRAASASGRTVSASGDPGAGGSGFRGPPSTAAPAVAEVTVAPRAREETPRERLGARLGDPNAFLIITDTIHFHPDRSLGGFGFLVLTEPTARRTPGVYLFDRSRMEWTRAYEIDDLPVRQWVRVTDWGGSTLPFQLYVIDPHVVAARWLSGSGMSVPPGQWDITGGPTAQELWVAQKEDAMIKRNLGHIA
jgi:hypothetical protein